MASTARRVKPQLGMKKKDMASDKRISVCSDCKKGIFKGHIYKWTRRGLVHDDCENPRGLNGIKR